MSPFTKFRNWYQNLPDKKKYLEFFSALLTLPMLITVILINLHNLNVNKNNNSNPTPAPASSIAPIVQVVIPSEASKANSQTTPKPTSVATPVVCKKGVGTVEITSISDNQTIKTDPVNIEIKYDKNTYCALVWSYRINNSSWSEYDDKSISLYNLTPGDKELEVRVKSIASGDEVILKKKFSYQPTITPTGSPSVTPSGSTTPTITN